jgi:hypothetical protein
MSCIAARIANLKLSGSEPIWSMGTVFLPSIKTAVTLSSLLRMRVKVGFWFVIVILFLRVFKDSRIADYGSD